MESQALLECFEWPAKLVNGLVRTVGLDILARSAITQVRSCTTFCSGLASVEIGHASLSRAFRQWNLQFDVAALHTCDIDPKCQQFIKARCPGSPCVFGSILECSAT
eukprot:15443281-Alexandrium_andersonii.AAC.1